MNIIWSPEAIQDLILLRGYIAEESPAGARRIVLRILRNVEHLLPDKRSFLRVKDRPLCGRPNISRSRAGSRPGVLISIGSEPAGDVSPRRRMSVWPGTNCDRYIGHRVSVLQTGAGVSITVPVISQSPNKGIVVSSEAFLAAQGESRLKHGYLP